MIIKNVKQFSFLLLVLAVVFVWFLKLISAAQHNQHMLALTKAQSTVVASVSLLVSELDVLSVTEVSRNLTKLNNISSISAWQLLDRNQQVISKSARENNYLIYGQLSTNSHIDFGHTLYIKTLDNQLLTLKLAFNLPVKADTSFIDLDYLVILLFVGVILLLAFYHFNWLYQLECYARYILANDNKPPQENGQSSSNPISQTINQLLLKNSLLLQDKMDLTQQIRKISFVDECTELGNQLFFKAEFEVRLHNHEEAESGILMLLSFVEYDQQSDLILDDLRLQSIANLLRHFIADIPNGIVARLKDNDFALLIPQQISPELDNLCKKLILQLDKAIFDSTTIKNNFVAIGVSSYKHGFDYYKVLAEADMALRNAQLQGSNNWFMYGEGLANHNIRGSLKWRSFLQKILEDRKVQLFGQKIQYFEQYDIEQLEVYIRIQDEAELLTADTFLPMANQSGLAVEFDRQVIDGMIKYCLCHENNNTPIIFTINLFVSSLFEQKFVTWLVKKLSSYPSLCRQLCFEIKETNINQNLAKLKIVMPQLAQLGIRWSIDKFGSPAEQQSFLDCLPISRIKIDRRFINNIHSEKSQQLFLQSLLIDLKRKNIEVYADGVEKEEDAKYLKTSGISGAQGFYYGKPLRLTRIEKLLKTV